MIRQCVVCGRDFKCSPSDNTVTCSKECSRLNKSITHKGKKNIWTEENRKKLREKGAFPNLGKGTEAAKKSPKAGRFETNVSAKIWKLTSPEGKIYICRNLKLWARGNCALFDCADTEQNVNKIAAGLKHAKRGGEGKKTARCCTYKGWRAEEGSEADYYYQKKNDKTANTSLPVAGVSSGFSIK